MTTNGYDPFGRDDHHGDPSLPNGPDPTDDGTAPPLDRHLVDYPINLVQARERAALLPNYHWWTTSSDAYFGTRYETDIVRHGLFVTSESTHGLDDDSERGYAIRQAQPDGRVRTIEPEGSGELLRHYPTLVQALAALEAWCPYGPPSQARCVLPVNHRGDHAPDASPFRSYP